MKTLLIFPPLWNNYYPYLSLPVLKAFLAQKGHDVYQWDVNADFNNEITKKDKLLECKNLLKNKLDKIDYNNNLKEFRAAEKLYLMSEFVVDEISNSLRILKSQQEFYIPQKLRRAKQIINYAHKMFTETNPYLSSMAGYEMHFKDGANFSINKINFLLDNPEKNFLIDYYNQNLIPRVLNENFDVVGLSIASYSQLIPALTLAKQLKVAKNSIHITVGGNVVTRIINTLHTKKELFNQAFDTAIIYEGETAFDYLLNVLDKGTGYEHVPNLVFKKNGNIIVNEKYHSEDVNGLPTPDFRGLNPDDYLGPDFSLPVYSTRGCYWNRCTFCDHSLIYKDSFRKRDPQKVVEDIEKLSLNYNVKHFHFHDECIPPSHCKNISEEIIRKGLDVCWNLNIRIEKQFTPEVSSLMYKSGCRMVSIGIESLNDRTLQRMDKGSNSETAKKVLKNFSDSKILNHGYIIIGFPGETYDNASDTFDFLKENNDILHYAGVSKFSLSDNSLISRCFAEYSISNLSGEMHKELKPDIDFEYVNGMNKAEINKLFNEYEKLLLNSGNRELYFLTHRIFVFLYNCKYGLPSLLSINKSSNDLDKAKPAAKTYSLNNSIYLGNNLPGDGLLLYNFVKKNKLTIKDQFVSGVLNIFKRDQKYSYKEILESAKKDNYKSDKNIDDKISDVIDILNKKEILLTEREYS